MATMLHAQGYLTLGVTLALFVIQLWAFVDGMSRRAELFPAADKLTKPAWLIILGLALVVHLVWAQPFFFLNLIGAVAAIVYLVDVRPALRALTRR